MSASTEHYPVKAGPLGGRYVIAKLANQRKAREYSVQATDDDRIIIQEGYGSKGSIGIFGFDGEGRFTQEGAHFPHLSFAKPFKFPAEFVRTCLDVAHPLHSQTVTSCVVIENTVRVF